MKLCWGYALLLVIGVALMNGTALGAATAVNPYEDTAKDISVTIYVDGDDSSTQSVIVGYPVTVTADAYCKGEDKTTSVVLNDGGFRDSDGLVKSNLGTYTITATYTDDDGTAHEAVVTVTVYPHFIKVFPKPNYNVVGVNTTIDESNFTVELTPNSSEAKAMVTFPQLPLTSSIHGKNPPNVTALCPPNQPRQCNVEITNKWILYLKQDPSDDDVTYDGPAGKLINRGLVQDDYEYVKYTVFSRKVSAFNIVPPTIVTPGSSVTTSSSVASDHSLGAEFPLYESVKFTLGYSRQQASNASINVVVPTDTEYEYRVTVDQGKFKSRVYYEVYQPYEIGLYDNDPNKYPPPSEANVGTLWRF
ncbi:MAG: hypothetical protein ACYTGH_04990 [Planctomycetota bacterium]|jgi:hypothetical protein